VARIELHDVSKTYGEHTAVRGLDMTIADGELLVLLGPSGCGKSTTMNMIAGLDSPTSGAIRFDGVDVIHRSPHERNIAMVFQSSLLYPHLSARQNIYMSLKRSGLSKSEIARRIALAAETVDVTRLLDKLPSQLSGGERQRVATAKAIVREPAGFLLDEPLSSLDASLRLSLRAELVNLQKRIRTTMVFVTHDQIEAMTMGDRIGVMREGQLEQIGTPTEVYNRPKTLFVAGFVGAPPMNFLKGAIEYAGGKLWFVHPALRLEIPGGPPQAAPRKEVILGIRPHLTRLSQSGGSSLPLIVYAIEQLGNEAIIICDGPAGEKIRAIVQAGFAAPVGARLDVTFDGAAAHLFDPDTGQVLAEAQAL
jgi:ABC-type sugar transport system ATPase subunit